MHFGQLEENTAIKPLFSKKPLNRHITSHILTLIPLFYSESLPFTTNNKGYSYE